MSLTRHTTADRLFRPGEVNTLVSSTDLAQSAAWRHSRRSVLVAPVAGLQSAAPIRRKSKIRAMPVHCSGPEASAYTHTRLPPRTRVKLEDRRRAARQVRAPARVRPSQRASLRGRVVAQRFGALAGHFTNDTRCAVLQAELDVRRHGRGLVERVRTVTRASRTRRSPSSASSRELTLR